MLCDHGVDNDATLLDLAQAGSGCRRCGVRRISLRLLRQWMGQVQAIRQALNAAGFTDTAIMSYSTKFASFLRPVP